MKRPFTLYVIGGLIGALLTATVLLSVDVNIQHGPITQAAITMLFQPGAAIAFTACPSLWSGPELRAIAVATLFAIWFNAAVGAVLFRFAVGLVTRTRRPERESNQASDATSKPAPSAGSSAHQG